jgi:hypothetical protein
LLGAALLTAALFSIDTPPLLAMPPLLQPDTEGRKDVPASPQPPLRTKAELDAWLKANAGKRTPFDGFSAGGRARAMAQVTFGERGLQSLPFEEIAWQLDAAQAANLLKLLGAEDWASMLDHYPADARWKGSATKPSAIDHRYLAYVQEEDAAYDSNTFQYVRNISQLYRKHFPTSLLAQSAGLSDPDLLLLARAAASVEKFTAGQPELQDLLALLPQLQKRGLDVTPLVTIAQRGLMRNGQLTQARALATAYPAVTFDPIPEVTILPDQLPSGPKWWTLSSDGKRMSAESADLSGTHLFVLAGCHFSIEAAEDARNDAELAGVFARYAHWLGEPPGSEKTDAWVEWNEKFPDTPIHLITLRGDWTVFPEWAMPTYAVVRDGKLIDKTTGSWRHHPENRTALVAMLRRHDLMPPQAKKTASSVRAQQAHALATALAD